MDNISDFPAHKIIKLLKRKEVSVEEVILAQFKKIQQIEEKVRAFVSLDPEEALNEARMWDKKIHQNKKTPPLCGIPIAIKDNICVKDEKTTCASRILKNFRPPYSATVVDRVKNAGCIIIGKTNMDEFAMGSSTENSAFQITRNPWNLETIPGGSSGGSAAAVASGEVTLALGSDTGGSIRQPAALCGIVGMKPTYGRVSRYGLVAFASSLDQIGPLTRDVTDCALLLQIISGKDEKDSTSIDYPVPEYSEYLIPDLKGIKVGLPKEYFVAGIEKEVREKVYQAARVIEDLGAHVEETSLPHTEYAVATYYLIATAEASSNLARYDGVKYGYRTREKTNMIDMYKKTRREGFGDEVKRRIMLGTYVLSKGYYEDYYGKALRVRTLIKQDFEKAFEKFDVLLTPTSPTVAFKVGEKIDDPLKMYLSDIFTISANLAGIPGISIPCGFGRENLPVGLQILGKPFEEETLLRVAYAYEQDTEWRKRKPEI
ncbi:Asp-tRNA(Asn)/Glu-tRNA(Gln) amidotransferase GatCAB subunit A [Candidatus Aerophobetes bacterium]|uniref:Glutamyl-tRNA(Gln) amidotransferase subunit A n=1 Tax=Aerophobetes bacterium TaxID=2030807 RepID=A0A662DFV6_UNCAE|nr:MAG: Asp-tRNA(Asn)/Glu-tRNA(Gln) amidotransferase GatCAB subunit A [Candidatus Aerophobetes bacterium]